MPDQLCVDECGFSRSFFASETISANVKIIADESQIW